MKAEYIGVVEVLTASSKEGVPAVHLVVHIAHAHTPEQWYFRYFLSELLAAIKAESERQKRREEVEEEKEKEDKEEEQERRTRRR
jgi:hypothetical protein